MPPALCRAPSRKVINRRMHQPRDTEPGLKALAEQ